MDALFILLAGLLGLLVGSVINALADDLPHHRPPRLPHYPDGTPRPPRAWLGLLAFLSGARAAETESAEASPPHPQQGTPSSAPRQKARRAFWQAEFLSRFFGKSVQGSGQRPETASGARLSWRHPLVELVTGLAFAGMAGAYADAPNLWAWFVYVAALILITVIDVEHRLILFAVIVPAALFALLVAAIAPENGHTFGDYALGGAVGFGVFFALYLGGEVYARARKLNVVAFGFGDVMLAALSGLMLGWQAFIFAAFIAVFAGAAGALAYVLGSLVVRRRSSWLKPLPYGPYIVFGTLIMLLARDEVRALLQR